MDIEEVLQKIVETLKREYDPEKIILFGSYARGDARPDSDVDLLVVKDSELRLVQRIVEVSRILRPFHLRPFRIPLDILVNTPQEVARDMGRKDPLMSEIARDGRVLYERAA